MDDRFEQLRDAEQRAVDALGAELGEYMELTADIFNFIADALSRLPELRWGECSGSRKVVTTLLIRLDVCAAFFERQRPVSTSMKPACMTRADSRASRWMSSHTSRESTGTRGADRRSSLCVSPTKQGRMPRPMPPAIAPQSVCIPLSRNRMRPLAKWLSSHRISGSCARSSL